MSQLTDEELAKDLKAGRDPYEYMGNGLADGVAGSLSDAAQHPKAPNLELTDSLCWRISRRLAQIGLGASEAKRKRVPRKAREKKRDVAQILEESKHEWKRQGKEFHCELCAARATKKELERKDSEECTVGRGEEEERAGKEPHRPPQASDARGQEWAQAANVDPSHRQMGRVGRAIVCWTCGSYSTSQRLGGLKGLCLGHKTTEARQNITNRLAKGEAPTTGHQWSKGAMQRAAGTRLTRARSTEVVPRTRLNCKTTPQELRRTEEGSIHRSSSMPAQRSAERQTMQEEEGMAPEGTLEAAIRARRTMVSQQPFALEDHRDLMDCIDPDLRALNCTSLPDFEEEDVFGHGGCLG